MRAVSSKTNEHASFGQLPQTFFDRQRWRWHSAKRTLLAVTTYGGTVRPLSRTVLPANAVVIQELQRGRIASRELEQRLSVRQSNPQVRTGLHEQFKKLALKAPPRAALVQHPTIEPAQREDHCRRPTEHVRTFIHPRVHVRLALQQGAGRSIFPCGNGRRGKASSAPDPLRPLSIMKQASTSNGTLG